ncbi:MAG: hypothetical protein GWO08_06705, partial [Gammaproteobacteria bacterium]|nr:hypothetical protein [Gammaproteobacteria bacterium]NIW44959.1 hypothetical protein [Gammaproteobacteria bacterium]NIX56134.1 hypothetical protein [candidate division Zixibacteria bacterium]
MRTIFGPPVIDVARSAYYRPELMQRNYYLLQQEVLRGSSEWTVAERELFATYVSIKNKCDFCIAAHSGFASADKTSQWVETALKEEQYDELDPKLGAMLKFLEKLTQQPWNMAPEDVKILREQGLNDAAIEDAVMVCVVFSIGNRLADS